MKFLRNDTFVHKSHLHVYARTLAIKVDILLGSN